MKLYLLDANVMICAKNLYYEFGRVDQYWDWLISCADQNKVKIPAEIMAELDKGTDALAAWVKRHRSILELKEAVDVDLLQEVVNTYAPDLNENELENVGADPFLIAYALANRDSRVVVTMEGLGKHIRHNKKIPSVCDELGVEWCSQWEFGRDLNFKA